MKIYEATIRYKLIRECPSKALNDPSLVYAYIKNVFDETPLQESFWVVCLNRKNFPLARSRVTIGTATSSLVHPREVFKVAILAGATGIIVAHNHPSGDPSPSSADIHITKQLKSAAKIVGIDLLDHIICGEPEDDPQLKGYYSFSEAGLT